MNTIALDGPSIARTGSLLLNQILRSSKNDWRYRLCSKANPLFHFSRIRLTL